jgi:hypothetical protein
MNFAAELQGVPAEHIGNVIDELNSCIWPLHLGPDKPTQCFRHIERQDSDDRQTAIERVDDASVETERRSRLVMVGCKRGLVQAIVPEPRFIHPARAGNPGPVRIHNLRAGVNRGQPFRLQFARVIDRTRILAEEIKAAERMAIIDVVVHLADGIVAVDSVRIADVERAREVRICREPFAVTRHRCGRHG